VTHERLRDEKLPASCDVVPERVAQRLRADARMDAGALADRIDRLAQRITTGGEANGPFAVPKHVAVAGDVGTDLLHDWDEVGQDRNPALALTLGDLGGDPDPPRPLKVLALQPAQLSNAQAGAHREVDGASFSHASGGGKHAARLLVREAVEGPP
jgi:hypothetical protein